ncbi:MAG: hypothetical protein KGZ42_13945 [Melioribacter sp.]|nr:hypothetical protein [Melioribacter sp.]
MKRILLTICTLLIFQQVLFAQTRTNLDIVNDLIEKSLLNLDNSVINRNLTFNFIYRSSGSYSFLKSKVVDSYIKKVIPISENESLENKLEHSINNITVEYSNPYKDGFFGNLLIERRINIDATLILSERAGIKTIDLSNSYKDTIEVEKISRLENPAIPFTQSTIPGLPLFSNLLEPIIVVGTLIVTIILFFTIRSK